MYLFLLSMMGNNSHCRGAEEKEDGAAVVIE